MAARINSVRFLTLVVYTIPSANRSLPDVMPVSLASVKAVMSVRVTVMLGLELANTDTQRNEEPLCAVELTSFLATHDMAYSVGQQVMAGFSSLPWQAKA